MAVTITNIEHAVVGTDRQTTFDVTGPASYTTGGEALTAAQLNQLMPHFAGRLAATDSDKVKIFESDRTITDQYLILDKTNDKIMYWTGAGQVAGSADLDGFSIKARITYKA